MSEDEFWALVERTRTDESQDPDGEAHAERANAELRSLGLAAAQNAYRIFHRKLDEAYRWDVWAVAYLVNGGCSDDGFEYFRWWLVRQGRKAFESVVADADSLPRFLGERDDFESESFGDLATAVIDENGGEFPPFDRPGGAPLEPAGEDWDEEDLDARSPKTAAWAEANG